MLVLRRKTNQALTIGADVKVIVLGIEGDSVRLGIEAPEDIPVQRVEHEEPSPSRSRR